MIASNRGLSRRNEYRLKAGRLDLDVYVEGWELLRPGYAKCILTQRNSTRGRELIRWRTEVLRRVGHSPLLSTSQVARSARYDNDGEEWHMSHGDAMKYCRKNSWSWENERSSKCTLEMLCLQITFDWRLFVWWRPWRASL